MRQLDDVLRGLGLDLGDWTLTSATGISADGLTIVGSGQHPFHNGVNEAWIAVIPEPGTGLLVMTGLLGLAYRQRRRTAAKTLLSLGRELHRHALGACHRNERPPATCRCRRSLP
jgi:hypothetical protein